MEPSASRAAANESSGKRLRASDEPFDPRVHLDRRTRPTPMISAYSFLGGRRASGDSDTYTDVYGLRAFALMLALNALNVLDSFFTLVYLQRGGSEGNPIADWLIRQGPTVFVLTKTLVVGVALGVLCLHKNFRRARSAVVVGTVIYVLLTLYHIFLFLRQDIGHVL